MLREVIQADIGIIFNRKKLMKFGVPGTEFAPKISVTGGMSPLARRVPQQPTVSNRTHDKVEEAEATSADVNRHSAVTTANEQEGDVETVNEESEQDVHWWYRDSIEKMRDELYHQPAWWILELIPFYIKRQDEHSVWKRHIR